MVPSGDIESTQEMFDIADDLQAQIVSKYYEGTFSLDRRVERLDRQLTVVTVGEFLTRRGNLHDCLYFAVLVDFYAGVLRDYDDGGLLTQDSELVITDISG